MACQQCLASFHHSKSPPCDALLSVSLPDYPRSWLPGMERNLWKEPTCDRSSKAAKRMKEVSHPRLVWMLVDKSPHHLCHNFTAVEPRHTSELHAHSITRSATKGYLEGQ
eukprot:1159529-Pelagomonas_calceolata.AAC.5